jgi:hypothetical protein
MSVIAPSSAGSLASCAKAGAVHSTIPVAPDKKNARSCLYGVTFASPFRLLLLPALHELVDSRLFFEDYIAPGGGSRP